MIDAPERIWLLPFDGEQRCWADDPDPSGLGHEDETTGYIRADTRPAPTLAEALAVPEVAKLVEAAKALQSDMLERAQCGIDTISGEQYRVVNAGNGVWTGFAAALDQIKET